GLERLPLAMELAAGWKYPQGLAKIAERVDEGFGLLTRGTRTSVPRHRTMQASIDWSYNLLTAHEQTLLRRVSVFVDGWTLEAVERVAGTGGRGSEVPATGSQLPSSFAPPPVLEGMAQLVEKSLVVVRHL